MKLTEEKKTLVTNLKAKYGTNVVTRKQILEFVKSQGVSFDGSRVPSGTEFPHWITNNKNIRVGRGAYNLDLLESTVKASATNGADASTVEAN